MTIYNYTRALVDNAWNINNPNRKDGEGNPKDLYQEINENSELNNQFKIICNSTSCQINFNFDLSAAQKTALDTIVSNHQNNL